MSDFHFAGLLDDGLMLVRMHTTNGAGPFSIEDDRNQSH